MMNSMKDNIFIDTNILVYAHDEGDKRKHSAAKKLLGMIADTGAYPSLSIQVLQELHVTLLRIGMSFSDSFRIVKAYSKWNIIQNDLPIFLKALDIQKRYGISYWDASIVAAAQAAEAKEIWTEDLQDGQRFGKIVARNVLR